MSDLADRLVAMATDAVGFLCEHTDPPEHGCACPAQARDAVVAVLRELAECPRLVGGPVGGWIWELAEEIEVVR